MDEATVRQSEQIKQLKEIQEQRRAFCLDCNETKIEVIAGIKTDVAILKLKVVGWSFITSLVVGIISGMLAAIIYSAFTK